MPTQLGEARRLSFDALSPKQKDRGLHRFVEGIIDGYDPNVHVQSFPQAVLGSRGVLHIVDSYYPQAQLPGHPKLDNKHIPGGRESYLPGELDATHPYAAILGNWSSANITVQQFNACSYEGGVSNERTLEKVRVAWLKKLGISQVCANTGADIRINFQDCSVLTIPGSGVYDGGGNKFLPLSSKEMAEVVYAGILAKRHLEEYIPLKNDDYVYGEVATGLEQVRKRHFFALERADSRWLLHVNSYSLTERLVRDLELTFSPEEIHALRYSNFRGYPRYSGMELLNRLASRRVGKQAIPQRDAYAGRNKDQFLIDVNPDGRESIVRGILSQLVGVTVHFADTADSATPSPYDRE